MSDWLPEKAIAMERRHILEGEKKSPRQEALVGQLIENGGRYQLVQTANEVLGLLRESLELSRDRLRYEEDQYGKAPEVEIRTLPFAKRIAVVTTNHPPTPTPHRPPNRSLTVSTSSPPRRSGRTWGDGWWRMVG